jgi:nucleotide-binding universal stress UspA family protein
MQAARQARASGIRRIVLATDLGAESVDLFSHALLLALRARAELFLLHLLDEGHAEAPWRRLPTVRSLLERWNVLSPEATPSQFEELGIRVRPLEFRPVDGDVPTALARRVSELKPEMLMLGTHVRGWFDQVIRPSVAEPVAREVQRPTLFVSDRSRGLVEPDTGELRLQRVLVPVTTQVPQGTLLTQLQRLLESLQVESAEITFLHVGPEETAPSVSLAYHEGWTWKHERRHGMVVEQILQAEQDHEVDLIAMATHGHDSWLDAVRGSTTERVLHRAHCPVLAVPV